jgi:hypothetical protein
MSHSQVLPGNERFLLPSPRRRGVGGEVLALPYRRGVGGEVLTFLPSIIETHREYSTYLINSVLVLPPLRGYRE